MITKYFTIDEANSLLPFIDQELTFLQKLKREFQEKYLELKRMKQAYSGEKSASSDQDPFFLLESELEFMQIDAKNHMNNIEMKGIELKDIDIGLVDFPAIYKDMEVLLCWRQGEERITFFHSREDGFSGRQAIE
jgi:hypothetical protein